MQKHKHQTHANTSMTGRVDALTNGAGNAAQISHTTPVDASSSLREKSRPVWLLLHTNEWEEALSASIALANTKPSVILTASDGVGVVQQWIMTVTTNHARNHHPTRDKIFCHDNDTDATVVTRNASTSAPAAWATVQHAGTMSPTNQ